MFVSKVRPFDYCVLNASDTVLYYCIVDCLFIFRHLFCVDFVFLVLLTHFIMSKN